MPKFSLNKLPQRISVRILKTAEGNYIAELPEYDGVFTQASSLEELNYNINDLVMTYFDVPRKYHHLIWYRPIEKRSEADSIRAPLHFQILLARNLLSQWR